MFDQRSTKNLGQMIKILFTETLEKFLRVLPHISLELPYGNGGSKNYILCLEGMNN